MSVHLAAAARAVVEHMKGLRIVLDTNGLSAQETWRVVEDCWALMRAVEQEHPEEQPSIDPADCRLRRYLRESLR